MAVKGVGKIYRQNNLKKLFWRYASQHCMNQRNKNLYSQPKSPDGRGIFPSGKANFRRNNCVYFKKIQRRMTGKGPVRW